MFFGGPYELDLPPNQGCRFRLGFMWRCFQVSHPGWLGCRSQLCKLPPCKNGPGWTQKIHLLKWEFRTSFWKKNTCSCGIPNGPNGQLYEPLIYCELDDYTILIPPIKGTRKLHWYKLQYKLLPTKGLVHIQPAVLMGHPRSCRSSRLWPLRIGRRCDVVFDF